MSPCHRICIFEVFTRPRGYNRPITTSNVPRAIFTSDYNRIPTAPQWPRLNRMKIRQTDSSVVLQNESIKLKKTMNQFKDENIRLRTKIKQANNELDRKHKAIQQLILQMQSESCQPANSFLDSPFVLELLKQLK